MVGLRRRPPNLPPHAALRQVVLWSRRLPDGAPYPPGMEVDGKGQVSSVYDWAAGTYQVCTHPPMAMHPHTRARRVPPAHMH